VAQRTANRGPASRSSEGERSERSGPERRWIVGLGNPGREYANSRHNVGFWVLDRLVLRPGIGPCADREPESLSSRLSFGDARRKFQAELREARLEIGGRSEIVVLVKPLTFMNLSGHAVRDVLGFYGTPRDEDLSERLIVVHDDIDLEIGRVRFRANGSAGGHRGVQSITDQLGHQRFSRLKIGVGRDPTRQAADYVLSRIPDEERQRLDQVSAESAEHLIVWLESGIATCMNRFNAVPRGPSDAVKDRAAKSSPSADDSPGPGRRSQDGLRSPEPVSDVDRAGRLDRGVEPAADGAAPDEAGAGSAK
jgi:PTH1 family peptidyl-tRNA hydrolase